MSSWCLLVRVGSRRCCGSTNTSNEETRNRQLALNGPRETGVRVSRGGLNEGEALASGGVVAGRVPIAIATAVGQAQAGTGPYTLSCVNAPSSTGIEDYVLTADEMGKVNAQLAEMNAFIKDQAHRHGWAYFELEDLYGRADLKPPFNAIAMMTDPATPYGPYISLDGIHPNAAGHHILAEAAAAALQAQYGGMVP